MEHKESKEENTFAEDGEEDFTDVKEDFTDGEEDFTDAGQDTDVTDAFEHCLHVADTVVAEQADANEEASDTESEDKYGLQQKIFVGNVGYRVSWHQLKDFFYKFGKVTYTHVVKDHLKKRPRGIAFVSFATKEEADSALQASRDELVLEGRNLRVHRAEESKRTTFKKFTGIPALTTEAGDTTKSTVSETDGQSDPNMVPSSTGINVNDLYDELLLYIMGFLSIKEWITLERVCHRWRHLSHQTWSTLKSIDFRNIFKRFGGVTDKILQSVLQKCGSNLVSLDLSASPRLLTDFAPDIIGHFCPNLTYLDLSGVAATNRSLKNLTTECSKLKVIKLQRCNHVGEKGLWWVLHHCKELEEIDMESNSMITGKCFHMAGPKIKALHLTGCSFLSDTAIFKLAELCPLIEELHLRSSVYLTDSAIEILGTSFPNMRVLAATDSYPETSLLGWSALGHSANLVELDLSKNVSVGDSTLAAISVGCLQLRTLDISSCHRNMTDAGILALAQLPVLENLDISYLRMIHDESLELIAINGCLKKLTAQACGELTDSSIISVAKHCPWLLHLDISGNICMTNHILLAFIKAVKRSNRRIVLHAGGTSMLPRKVWLPACLEVSLMDLSKDYLRANLEELFPELYEVEVWDGGGEYWDQDGEDRPDPAGDQDGEDRPDPAGNFRPAGEEIGECPWEEEFADMCNDFFDNDDPLHEELWDLG
ncbi:putative RNA-binding protein EEED8.10 [Haliotis rubra]|uniref:putative RNA-binding protein EEED8.10 n=1 Tax=Haliotis rubra TaxID=36100 RepID=UPI001EE58AD5|nr:putative RNA-binding protein EEED8.10 [Haliotis rubra]